MTYTSQTRYRPTTLHRQPLTQTPLYKKHILPALEMFSFGMVISGLYGFLLMS